MLTLYVTSNTNNTLSLSLKGEGTVINKYIEKDLVNELVKYIKNRKPNKIIFNNEKLQNTVLEQLYHDDIAVDELGNIYYDSDDYTYTQLDKDIVQSNTFELLVSTEDFSTIFDVLTSNDYLVDYKMSGSKIKLIITPLN